MLRGRRMIDRPLTLRPATAADARLLLSWRNDMLTRANSRDRDIVSWEAHQAWLTAVLADPARELLIAERAATPVGTVRFDRTETGIELSWTVAPERRHQGIGRAMVALAVAHRPGARLRAEIARGNRASISIARAAGFRLDGETVAMTIWVRD